MFKKLILSTLFVFAATINFSNEAYSFILDDLNKQERKINGKPQITTPLQESIERGGTEHFAQFTGLVEYSLDQDEMQNNELFTGVGTLIGPNTVLTAAHVIQRYLENPAEGYFTLKNNTDTFRVKIKNVFLPGNYPARKSLVAYENERDNLNLERKKKLLECDNFIYKSSLSDEIKSKISDPNEMIRLLLDPNFSENEQNELFKVSIKIKTLVEKVKLLDDQIDIFQEKNKEIYENGVKHDIAIIQLEDEISNIKIFPTLNAGENIPNLAYGVSINNITKNFDGSMISEGYEGLQRHIAIFGITKEDSLLKCKLKLPDDYKHTNMGLEGPKQFTYHYDQINPEKGDPFLKGSIQSGDSGSPLLASYKTAPPKIFGILSTARSLVTTSDPYPAGGEYVNIWTPVNPHKSWIEKTMKSYNS